MDKWMNKRNGIIAAIAVVLIVIAVIVSTSFSSAMTLDEAKSIAQKYVPSTAKFVSSEEEDRYYEVAFYDEENGEGYEVEVNKETKVVKKVEMQKDNDEGSQTIVLTEDDVKKIIKEKFEGVTSVSVILTKDNELFEYEASFKADDFYGDADVNAETGVILDSVVKYGTAVTIPTDDSAESELLSYEQAKDAVIEKAGGGTVTDMDLDKENGEYFYEVELHKDNMEYDYIVNATTGEVTLESEHESYFDDDPYEESEEYIPEDNAVDNVDNSNDDIISEQEAKDIVLAKIPGATIVEFNLEKDDGRYEYEGTAHLGDYEYEFEINASSGVITNWDKESLYDDEWDD